MLISKKTNCFNCDGEMERLLVERYPGWTELKFICFSCNSSSLTLLAIDGQTGHDNPILKNAGLGIVQYFDSEGKFLSNP